METITCNHCGAQFSIPEIPEDERIVCKDSYCQKLIDPLFGVDGAQVESWIHSQADTVLDDRFAVPEKWLQRNIVVRALGIVIGIPILLLSIPTWLIAQLFSIIDPEEPRRVFQGFYDLSMQCIKGWPGGSRLVWVALKAMKRQDRTDGELIVKACVKGVSTVRFADVKSADMQVPEPIVVARLDELRSLEDVPADVLNTLEDMTFAVLWTRIFYSQHQYWNEDGLRKLAADRDSQIGFARLLVQMSPLNVRVHPILEKLADICRPKAPRLAATLMTPKKELEE